MITKNPPGYMIAKNPPRYKNGTQEDFWLVYYNNYYALKKIKSLQGLPVNS